MGTFGHLVDAFGLAHKTVVDIGCSEGHHLRHFGAGSMGLTIIEEHVAAARGQGLTIMHGNVEDPLFSLARTFDVVWANNIFEHLNAPHLFLMKARTFVKPNGTLILGVPVVPRIPFLTHFKKFRGAYAASHVNFFTRQTLIDTVRAGGWTVREARSFFFRSAWIDALMHPCAPHIYVIAHPTEGFAYPYKRLRSLEGYA